MHMPHPDLPESRSPGGKWRYGIVNADFVISSTMPHAIPSEAKKC
jgi:hypothetical protein